MSIDYYYCGQWPGLLNAPPPCSSSSSYICIIFCQGPFWPSTKYTFLVKVHKMLYSSSSTLMWISLRCPALLACNLHYISWKILKLDHIICIYVNLSMSNLIIIGIQQHFYESVFLNHLDDLELSNVYHVFFSQTCICIHKERSILNNIFRKLWILNNVFWYKFKISAFYESDLHFRNIRNFSNKYKWYKKWNELWQIL